eukprot:965844-Pyramimonas_sp.AAC.1
MATGFHISWRPDRMPAQGPEATAVGALSRDDAVWAKARFVSDLGKDIETERKWMQGCPCHEEERRRHAAKGGQSRQRLSGAFDRWRNNQIALRTTPDEDPTGDLPRHPLSVQPSTRGCQAQVDVR